jgi:hypothetical protein
MALYALEDLDDALDVTREFLTPIEWSVWLKLAFVVLFVGGPGANGTTVQYTLGGNGNGGELPAGFPDVALTPGVWLLIAAAIAVALLLGLLFAAIGSIMEFVFVESIRTRTVTVRRYWSRRWRQGLRLFGFRLGIAVVIFGSVALLVAPLVLSAIGSGAVSDWVPWAVFLVLLPLFVLLAILVGLVNGFTTVFVVPVMILEDRGVLAGWRRLWPTITAHWEQFLAYAVVSVFLTVFAGILVGIVTAVLAVLLLIPFGILGAIGWGLLYVAAPIGWVVIAVVAVFFVLAVIVVAAFVQVPVQTYLRYYALFVLGDIEPEFDLIPDQRDAVRPSE